MYELYLRLYQSVALFPKRDRYTLGVRLESQILELLELFLLAETKDGSSKLLILKKADNQIRLLKILIRLAYEVKALPQNKYIAHEEKFLEIGRMLGGWLRQTKLKGQPEAPR